MRSPHQIALALVAATACLATVDDAAVAAPTRCPAIFAGGQAPDPLSEAMRTRATELCYTMFATMNSGLTRTSVWSAEHLTREQVSEARGMEREDSFHPDPNVAPQDRAELSDYRGSGYDRGHMSPNGDMPNPQAQSESFSLANMVPQSPENNRGLWARIESTVRDMTVRDGEVYVVTGPVFSGTTISSLKGRVLVPTQVFKAVYSPSTGVAGVYLTPNAPGEDWRSISVNELRRMTNLDVFPALPDAVKDAVADLPAPAQRRAYGGRRASGSAPPPTGGSDAQGTVGVGTRIFRALKDF